jgi:hypothetical protein
MDINDMKSARKTKPEKVSAMILKVAEGYIDMGETVEEKENYLRSACSAWNIACMSGKKRENDLKRYIENYEKINEADEDECNSLKEDMKKLIKRKDELYPGVNNIHVVDSKIERINGKDHVTIASMKIN